MSAVLHAAGLAVVCVCWCSAQSAALTAAESAFAKLQPELERAQTQWEKSGASAAEVDWTVSRGLVVQRLLVGRNRFDGKRVVDVDLEHEEAVRFGIHDKFALSGWILSKAPTGAIVTRGKDAAEGEGYGLYLKDGKVQANFVRQWLDDALRVEAEKTLELNQWHNVTATYDGSGIAGSVRIYIDGQAQKLKVNLDSLHGSFETKEPLLIGGGRGPENNFRGQIRDVRIYRAVLTREEVEVVATDTPVSTIAQITPEKRTRSESEKIRLYFLEHAAPAKVRETWQRVVEMRSR